MSKLLHLGNKTYIASVAAGEAVGYSHDYLSRLCRSASLDCRRIGRVWYIEKTSLDSFAEREKGSAVTRSRPDDIPVHNSVYYGYLAEKDSESSPVSVTSDPSVDESKTEDTRLDVASPSDPFFAISQQGSLDTSSIQTVRSSGAHEIAFNDNDFSGGDSRNRRTVLRPLVGMLSVIIFATGGYAAAQVYETPIHELTRQVSTSAQTGFAYILDKSDPSVLRATARGPGSKHLGRINTATDTVTASALERALGMVHDISNEIAMNIQRGMAELVTGIPRDIPGRLVQYGDSPVALVASTLSSLTQKALEDSSSVIYEPITGVNVLAVAEDSGRNQVVAAVPEPSIIEQTVINQPVIERVVEKQFTVVESGVTLEQLQQTENELRALFGEYVSSQPVNPVANFRSIALTQRIDTLDGTDISNGTFTSGSITNSSVSATTLSASGVATFSGDIDVSGGTLEVPNSTSLPGSCSVGEIYFDSDAASGQRIYACESADTWVLQGGVAADSLDFSDFLDAMTVDATTSFDLDTNAADLNFDSNTFVIDSSANSIGIGTTIPPHVLSVFQDNNAARTEIGIDNQDQRLVLGAFYESGVAQYGSIQATNDAESSATSLALNPDGGNVGIGTTNPQRGLDVNGSIRIASGSVLEFGATAVNNYIASTDADNYLAFATNNGERMRIDSSGNVGIGTTTPGTKLHVAGQARVDGSLLYNDENGQDGTKWGLYGWDDQFVFSKRNADFSFNSTYMVIKDGGNVGIGDTSPAALLTVGVGDLFQFNSTGELTLNESSATYDIWIQGADVANGDARNLALLGNASTDDLILNYNTEYDCVSIGGTSCSNALDVTGTITATGNITLGFGSFQDTSVSASGASTLCYDGSGVFGACTSLSEFKENQQDLTLGLETIMQLRPVEFDWIPSKGGARDFGFIAEEVASVNPLLAAYESPGGALVGVKYRHLTALLAKGIQEIATPIDVSRAGSVVSAISIDENGNVGIGTTTPSAQLHTTGTVRFENFGAGTLTTDADGNVSVSSDERLKVVEGMFASGLSAVLAINPIQYRWNEDSGFDRNSIYAGFSAQNVREVLPEAVGEDKRGFLTLSDRPILASAINAIKEVWQQLEEYMTRTERLEQRVAELEARLNGVVQVTPVVPEPTTNAATPEPEDRTLTMEVVGNNPATIAVGSSYADLGAIARDTNGALLSVELTLDGNPVPSIDISTDAPATYLVTYRAQDGEGNNIQATRKVIVVQNDEPAQDILTDQKATPPEPEAKTSDSDGADTKNENGDTATSGEGEAASSSPGEPPQDDTGPRNTKETNANTGASEQANSINDTTTLTE